MKYITEKVDAVQCSVCRVIRPVAQFMRRPSRKQLSAWGYAGEHNEDFDRIGDICHTCKPIKRTADLPRSRLEEMVKYGDISHVDFDAIMQSRVGNRQQVGKRVTTERWMKKRIATWTPLIAEVNEEARKATYQIRNAKSSIHKYNRYTIIFFNVYRDMLAQIRAEMQKAARLGASEAPTDRWWEFIDPHDRARLKELWQIGTVSRRLPIAIDSRYEPREFHPLYRKQLTRDRSDLIDDLLKREANLKRKPILGTDSPRIPPKPMSDFMEELGLETDAELMARKASEPKTTPPPDIAALEPEDGDGWDF